MLVQKEMTSMEEKIVQVLNEMSAYLTIAQMKKLQERKRKYGHEDGYRPSATDTQSNSVGKMEMSL